jgi:hypothetical protein
MNPWLILGTVIGLLVLAGVANGIWMWRKYVKVVSKRLDSYASLAIHCPIDQVPLVFQEVVELTYQVALTRSQHTELRCILSYLMGRNDEAKLPSMNGNKIVIV